MLYTSPWGERFFAQIQPDLFTIQNNGGAWNSAGAQYIRVTEDSFSAKVEEPRVATNIKHGTTSQLQRIPGRKSASWGLNVPIVPSGVQAVPPDVDPLLQGVFGGPGSLVTGTRFGNAWAYSPVDQQVRALTLLGFQHGRPATGNRYVLGALPTEMSIDFNGNVLGMSLRGVAVSAMHNEEFGYTQLAGSGATDTFPQGGLGSFPGEPGSFTANGSVINAFGGTLYIQGNAYSFQCDQFSIRHSTGLGLKGNFIDSAYAGAPTFGSRSTSVQLGFVNNDSSVLAFLKVLGRQGVPVTVEFYLGSVAGRRMYVQANGVQLDPSSLNDSQSFVNCSFGDAASSVAPGFSNDLVMGFA